MSRITRATFKSFLRRNEGKLYFKPLSSFDGMVDCVMPSSNASWRPLARSDRFGPMDDNTLGYAGVWLVGGSRDRFNAHKDDLFEGIEVYNCCGNFIVATRTA